MKIEWIQQINGYAYLYGKYGFSVQKGQIVAILRDWSMRRASIDKTYPQVGVQVLDVKMWDYSVTRAFLESRVDLHQISEKLNDDDLPYCSAEERWEKPTLYCVWKKGNKQATNNYEDPLKADQRMSQLQLKESKKKRPAKYFIEERKGESTRCEFYCLVKPWCNQYAQIISKH